MNQHKISDDAIEEKSLLSVKSLGSSLPADPDQARLAYAHSLSLVSFLIDLLLVRDARANIGFQGR